MGLFVFWAVLRAGCLGTVCGSLWSDTAEGLFFILLSGKWVIVSGTFTSRFSGWNAKALGSQIKRSKVFAHLRRLKHFKCSR